MSTGFTRNASTLQCTERVLADRGRDQARLRAYWSGGAWILRGVSVAVMGNSRSLHCGYRLRKLNIRPREPHHYASPDFLWNLVALSNFMRPSLRKGAYAALSSAVWQEIRVRFDRDHNS